LLASGATIAGAASAILAFGERLDVSLRIAIASRCTNDVPRHR
jgi:hypothetical protein